MTERVVVRSSSVEAAKALQRRNAERGRQTDPTTSKLAGARYVGRLSADQTEQARAAS